MKKLVFKVEIGYKMFKFDDADEAMAFAMCAKLRQEDEVSVEIKVLEDESEEQE